jgi:hypothetical protein
MAAVRAGDPAEEPLSTALDILGRERVSSCLLDLEGRILAVNDAWDRFARENGGEARCLGARLVGSAYASHVEGAAPRAQVEEALSRALGGKSFAVESECSSADRLRVLRTQHVPVRRADDAVVGVLLVHATVHDAPMGEVRPLLPPDDASYRRDDGLVLMCSCCRRVQGRQAPERWDFVPAYLERPPHPVSHGFCEACFLQYGIRLANAR